MPSIELPHNWKERAYQRKLWRYLNRDGKRAISIWHRRSGKDEVCLHYACIAAHERPATYWHMLPEYGQARKAIWSAVNPNTGKRRIDEAFPHELREVTRENEMFIRFKSGATWQCVGSDKYDATVGSPPAGITFSEWALSNPSCWAYLAPILAENNGWANFITTSRGRNHAFTMLEMARREPDWFTEVLSVTDTARIAVAAGEKIPMTLEAVEKQRREYHGIYGSEAGDALIDQEYFCSFQAAVLGSYYGRLINKAEADGRIGDFPYDPTRPVHTAWDLGVSDNMVLWFFQVYPDHLRVIDHYSNTGYALGHYADVKRERGYDYGLDYVPQDVKVRDMSDAGADRLARQRVTQMITLKLRPELVPPHKVDDGINAVRTTLPLARFDRVRCMAGIESLRAYKKDWDEKNHCFRDTPKHDFSSHDADAFRTLSMAWKFQIVKPVAPPIAPVKSIAGGDDGYTMNEAWKMQRTERRDRV